jgi:hypothetical protein
MRTQQYSSMSLKILTNNASRPTNGWAKEQNQYGHHEPFQALQAGRKVMGVGDITFNRA